MIGSVGEERSVGFRKERCASSIPFGKDDFVEELDGRVLCASRLAFMNKLVEGLCVTQHVHIIAITVRHTLQKLLHLEMVGHPCLAPVARCWMQKTAVSVEKRGEAAHESRANLVSSESNGANKADGFKAPVMHGYVTTWQCQ